MRATHRPPQPNVAVDWLYRFLRNFGLAILAITVIIKAIFFPLANKSYASMAKMKAVQPQMMAPAYARASAGKLRTPEYIP